MKKVYIITGNICTQQQQQQQQQQQTSHSMQNQLILLSLWQLNFSSE
jgi:hypothetical protein